MVLFPNANDVSNIKCLVMTDLTILMSTKHEVHACFQSAGHHQDLCLFNAVPKTSDPIEDARVTVQCSPLVKSIMKVHPYHVYERITRIFMIKNEPLSLLHRIHFMTFKLSRLIFSNVNEMHKQTPLLCIIKTFIVTASHECGYTFF